MGSFWKFYILDSYITSTIKIINTLFFFDYEPWWQDDEINWSTCVDQDWSTDKNMGGTSSWQQCENMPRQFHSFPYHYKQCGEAKSLPICIFVLIPTEQNHSTLASHPCCGCGAVVSHTRASREKTLLPEVLKPHSSMSWTSEPYTEVLLCWREIRLKNKRDKQNNNSKH